MKSPTIIALIAFQYHLISASLDERVPVLSDPARHHARDLIARDEATVLVPRDPHDRGTWNLDCTKAQMACNNACWSINCLGQDTKTMYYDPDNNNDDNRVQAGCNVPNSVCNAMPFSQIFNDPLSLSQPSCDEWPMAETKQQPYSDRPPNSLRCIETGDNASGGSQLANFLDLSVNYPSRKGTQAFADGDYWVVEFQNTDNSPYCKAEKGSSDCKNDNFQFQMEKLGNGVSGEYDYSKNNQYCRNGEDATSNINVVQCHVHLHRSQVEGDSKRKRNPIGGPITEIQIKFDATVYDYEGNQKGTESGVPTDETPITVTGLTTNLLIYSTGGTLDDDAKYEIEGVDTDWSSSFHGAGGPYCSVGKVDGDSGTQDEDCYFPCFINAPSS